MGVLSAILPDNAVAGEEVSVARRVLALIILGLILAFCVALAATQSLTNRTGRTATAVTVTFSEQVRITSYDETVFPTKDPSSRSDTFTFSGGQLENGARFSMSWTPSTAEITSTEWETTGAASSGSAASSAPLTYEQIMAQIAHYPGPEEPLYVPAEGEQIWLTDLEGHADVYDNDSIKINYAPGFDKSQITRIDVYRNGVKMRFVPAVFDVLTNEQMKTFDGNPAEKTPKSSHTDHAVCGYGFEFRIVLTDGKTLAISVLVENPVRYTGEVYAYMEQIWPLETPSMTDTNLKAEFDRLRTLGFAGIQIDTYYYMDSDTSTSVFTNAIYNTAIHWTVTPSESELRRMLRLAKQSGLRTWLRPQVQLTDSFMSSVSRFTWRGAIEPTSVPAWFASYKVLLLELASLAQTEGVDILDLGVELQSMQQHTSYWSGLATAVRGIFTREVSYSEATNLPLQHFHYCNGEPIRDLLNAAFWTPFDQIAMNAWPSSGGCHFYSEDADQSLSSLAEDFHAFWIEPVDYYRSSNPTKVIALGEAGSRNADATLKYGYQYWDTRSGTTDYQEVADFWAAILSNCQVLGIKRVSAWTYWIFSEALPDWRLFNFKKTPAEKVIASFLR
jgi:hypothetical protein